VKTAENIKKISLIFFIILGIVHIVAGMMTANNYFLPASFVINRVLDIPFAMSGLIYALSGIYVNLPENKHKIAKIAFGILSILILASLLYINLLIPDKPPFNV
jgi:uncharacterized membrane protein